MNLLEKLSAEDYIQLEEETGLKHEYHDGWVVAMAGVTEEHDLITSAIRDHLRRCLRKKAAGFTAVIFGYLFRSATNLCIRMQQLFVENHSDIPYLGARMLLPIR